MWRYDPHTCSLAAELIDIIDGIEQATLRYQQEEMAYQAHLQQQEEERERKLQDFEEEARLKLSNMQEAEAQEPPKRNFAKF